MKVERDRNRSPQNNKMEDIVICYFCSQPAHMQDHLNACPSLVPGEVHDNPACIKIDGRGNICKSCWCLFDFASWRKHNRSQACIKGKQICYQRDLSNRDLVTLHQRSQPDPQLQHSIIASHH